MVGQRYSLGTVLNSAGEIFTLSLCTAAIPQDSNRVCSRQLLLCYCLALIGLEQDKAQHEVEVVCAKRYCRVRDSKELGVGDLRQLESGSPRTVAVPKPTFEMTVV